MLQYLSDNSNYWAQDFCAEFGITCEATCIEIHWLVWVNDTTETYKKITCFGAEPVEIVCNAALHYFI
jgi:hypothetical protein